MNAQAEKTIPFLRRNISLLFITVVLCIFPLLIHNAYTVHVFIMFFFYAYLALAWNIIGGYGGQLSLGHGVFYGLGAYTSTLLFVDFGLSPWIGMLAGGGLAAVVSMVIGYPCFRLHGPFFAMSTLAVLEVFRILTVYFSDLTGGSVGVSIPITFGFTTLVFQQKMPYLYIMIGFFYLAVIVSKFVDKSKLGYELLALREDEDAAESTGVNVTRTKMKAMMTSAFLTAIGGSFHAQYILYIDPSGEFGLGHSVLMPIMAILGGVGTVLGPILGAAFLVPLQEILRGWLGGQWHGLHLLIYGLLLIIVVLFLPNGILAWLKGWFSKMFGKVSDQSEDTPKARIRPAENYFRTQEDDSKRVKAADSVVLKTRSICMSFGGLMAIKNLDIEISRGEITGLIGPNGAGKTTFFNLVSGFLKPDSGGIEYNGVDITGLRPAHKLCRKGIGRTFQIVKPFGNITTLENIMIGVLSHVDSEKQARQSALEVLDFVGLYHKKNHLAKGLTLGDRKRLELGKALATRPHLLLLDEIMAGLNPKETEEAIELTHKVRQQGITVILIEHVMRVVMNLSDRVIILHHGEKIAEGSPHEIASNERVIKAYLGEEYVIA
ncbi:MAG: branched-chain amino acid ABC transporter ATP-binding protein/permease [Desulfobacteraceae bacterium]|nr:branched-chain amino acid ABC transporter ATP-binding protein/permease [Desulfobacteraceae bacterium]